MSTNIRTLAVALAVIRRRSDPTAPASRILDAWRELRDVIRRRSDPTAPASRILDAWRELRDAIMRDAPSGSGIDCGTKVDEARCTPTRVVLTCAYHHMNEYGMYSGWTEHTITITPTFEGVHVAVGGRDRNGIKDYLADTYRHWATAECPHKFTLPPRDEA